ncbi:hypothetical protein Poli38472_001490 [Pythium oligandrum]|uniref:Lipoxygenase domain-containing protein n=1 Tax=Pythium oligandrum TaxID=41045 RepID=A0A8K1CU84_PYTOL|nr:hypothetical protein Poli38472_001490 [Pythium oligandrum]|eukprot:TMW69334.1 hypothetical protein Poli38472_001490 [Pythium oligandrum]
MLHFWFHRVTVLVAVLAAHLNSVQAILSTPQPSDSAGPRAAGIAMMQTLIRNEPRTMWIGPKEYPFYDGANPRPGSLTEKIRFMEGATIMANATDYANYFSRIVMQEATAGNLTSVDKVASVYNLVTKIPKPMSTDIGDVTFGQERLTIKAMKLRLVHQDEYQDESFQLNDDQLAHLCGSDVTWSNIRGNKALFVEDYHDAAQWNDQDSPEKYVPNVVGFFCYNHELELLLPIEIRYSDTKLAYSPLDTDEEWTLAKMGLNAASVVFHQWAHMADTHAMTAPIRVEALRNMAPEHPVRALVEYHGHGDIGLELLVSLVLLSHGTPMDRSFGWGAPGSAQFLHHYLQNEASITHDLLHDIERRGLLNIPTHKYVQYGTKLYDAIYVFVKGYVATFYEDDEAVKSDFELQNWAAGCATVPHLKGFPASITSQSKLRGVLTHVLYLSGVKHHVMNSDVAWQSISIPYSSGALWKAMPQTKGEAVNLMEYAPPLNEIHTAPAGALAYLRPIPESQTWMKSYNMAPFSDEPALKATIEQFHEKLTEIDNYIEVQESMEAWPYEFLRPSKLPYYSWV